MNKPSLLNLFQRSLWVILLSLPVLATAAPDWQPVPANMMTRWAQDVTPKNVWREYHAPADFERKQWENLNGLWDYAVTPKAADQPTNWQGKILVPFGIESTLSGVGKIFLPDRALWYRRTIQLKPKADKRVLLNFEAVDYQTTVWVNGQPVGEHIGGNTAFSFDITSALKKGDNEIIVRVWDATDGSQLRGKQSLHLAIPSGIRRIPASGRPCGSKKLRLRIWRTRRSPRPSARPSSP